MVFFNVQIIFFLLFYNAATITSNYEDVLTLMNSLPDDYFRQDFVGPNLKYVNKTLNFHCKSLFRFLIKHSHDKIAWPPLNFKDLQTKQNANLMNALSFNGVFRMRDFFVLEKQNGGEVANWSNDNITRYRTTASTCGSYNLSQCEVLFTKYANLFPGQRGLVIGSQSPWAEGRLLRFPNTQITTLDYLDINSSYPGLSTLHPIKLAKEFVAGKTSLFDFIFSFSSLEHDGTAK